MNEILIVDDEPHVIRVMRRALERAGYGVRQASNGEQALTQIAERRPDLLITDIDMPRMTGQELCQTIVQTIPEREFGIYVLTSRAETEHREWSAQIPNLQFMEKPVSIRQLLVDLEGYFGVSDDQAGSWTIAH
jgi:CheY-like chemotaxis protein